jgi:hypothetical protein
MAQTSRLMSTQRKLRRHATVALLIACSVLLLASGVGAQTSGGTPPPVVKLRGEGSDDPLGEMTAWQNELYGTGKDGLIDLHYLANGGYNGREDFLCTVEKNVDPNCAKNAPLKLDYVLSGVPFTPAELGRLANGAADLIDAPVHVAAMGMLLQPPRTPNGSFGVLRQVCDPNNPPTPIPPGVDPNDCTMWTPYTGPTRVPHANLAAMLFSYPAGATPPLKEWAAPGSPRPSELT